MSNIQLIIEERSASIGSFQVGRLLPFREKRMVGPFAFIDHMGPVSLPENENFDVAPHPHIGLSTLTYLFEGSIMHRDSIGSAIEIKPGEVNWMTAGKGIVHSERTPDHLRNLPKTLHGLQIWIALPTEFEDCEPNFFHASADTLPSWNVESTTFKLIAGQAFGRVSPVPVYSKLFMVEAHAPDETTLSIGHELFGEVAMYILEGSVTIEGHDFGSKQIIVAKNSELCTFAMSAGTTIYLFGGEPFPEERYIYWNFVSSSKEKIERSKQLWREQKFPIIDGETEFVPLPESR